MRQNVARGVVFVCSGNVNLNNGFWRGRLSDAQRADYDRLLAGFRNRQVYGVNGITAADETALRPILSAVLNDNPELYSLFTGNVSFQKVIGGTAIVTPRFLDCNGRRFEAAVDKIIRSANNLRTDYEKALFVKDFIGDRVVYDYDSLKQVNELLADKDKSIKLDNPAAFTAYGAIVDRKATCDGIAKAVCCLLRRLGVQCVVINGVGRKGGEPHSWNVVRIGGGCYHLDVTNDLVRKEFYFERTYHFFLATDTEMYEYFTPDDDGGLVCNSVTDGYYVHNGVRFTSVERLRRYVLDGAYGEVLAVQYAGGMPASYIQELLKTAAERNITAGGRQYLIRPFAGGKYFMLVKSKYEIPKRRIKGD